ncbi:hypothetical protein EK21DRAFT_100849 [Setomelanomma holmii]|uniref:Uncharacterized protein n=1 Tax=Setomelanomma holmii TaxID=210430 RepID=A0A9P4LMQ9_9PLEO|nr:hypothetical protein EK21DRAFT_100849 [Setomelanomma holmii]
MSARLVQVAQKDQLVRLGLWTNWSQGSVAGLTLTTTISDGGLLIAFIALFVAFAGTCFWTIVSFAIHQILSRQDPQQAVYHQRQAILRNSDTSVIAFWKLLRLSWSWRKQTRFSKRTLIPLVISAMTFGAFSVAGIFSSKVAVTRGGEILINGDQCATLKSSLFTTENYGLLQTYMTSRIRGGSRESCRTFVRSNLPFTVANNIECPLPGKDRICSSTKGAVRFDSGYLNSHFDLGINSPPSQRFLYRIINECPQFELKASSMRVFLHHQTSRKHDTHTSSANTYNPIPELLIPNADVGVIFLETHDTPFFSRVNDPWFSAQRGPVNRSTPMGDMEVYLSDRPISVLACVQQYQFCNPNLDANASCTPPRGIFEAAKLAAATIFPEAQQREMFIWSVMAITDMASDFNGFASGLGGATLLASESFTPLGQYALPNNQWELEVEHMFKLTLADLQRAILDHSTGPRLVDLGEFHSPPATAEGRSVCNNQKIRSDSFTSFNVLGLVLLFAMGGMIMITAAILPCAVERSQRHKRLFASLEWITNDTLQLQRLAHEAVRAGTWECACDDYPRTREGDLLACLDLSNLKHPMLRATIPSKSLDQEQHIYGSKDDKDCGSTHTFESTEESLLGHKIPHSPLDFEQMFASSLG